MAAVVEVRLAAGIAGLVHERHFRMGRDHFVDNGVVSRNGGNHVRRRAPIAQRRQVPVVIQCLGGECLVGIVGRDVIGERLNHQRVAAVAGQRRHRFEVVSVQFRRAHVRSVGQPCPPRPADQTPLVADMVRQVAERSWQCQVAHLSVCVQQSQFANAGRLEPSMQKRPGATLLR